MPGVFFYKVVGLAGLFFRLGIFTEELRWLLLSIGKPKGVTGFPKKE